MADHIPVSTFSAQEGMFTSDLSNAGAPAIMAAILELIDMFDKTATHVGGDAGGIGALNIKDDAITDVTIGNRTINDAIATALSDTGTLNDLLSFIAKQLKALAGTSGWKVTANETVNGLDARVDAIEAVQIDDINGLNNGSITISGGVGVEAHITVTVDAVTKTITLTPVGTMVPAAHASSHAPGGIDSVDAYYCTVSAAVSLQNGINANNAAIGGIIGTGNTTLLKQRACILKNDTRTTELTYTNGSLTGIVEKDGSTTVKSATLAYNTSGNLITVTEVAGGTTVTTTLNYTAGVLTSVTRAVS